MKTFDAILLLGTELDEKDGATQALRARVKKAAQAYCERRSEVIVACGGVLPGHALSEAEVMAGLLEEDGVPADVIIRENRSQTTAENFLFAAELLEGAKGKRVLVVTSDYHLRRALLTSRRAGFRAAGMPAPMAHDTQWKRKRKQEWLFMVDLLMGWQDPGRQRPQWTYDLFDCIFGKRA